MNWKIEAVEPVTAQNLESVLEAARDEWIKTTPQLSDSTAKAAFELISETHNQARAKAVEAHAKVVAANSSKLDAIHSRVVAQMDAAIASAVMVAGSLPKGSYMRATLSGHYEPGHQSFLDERVSISVDQARPPVTI